MESSNGSMDTLCHIALTERCYKQQWVSGTMVKMKQQVSVVGSGNTWFVTDLMCYI